MVEYIEQWLFQTLKDECNAYAYGYEAYAVEADRIRKVLDRGDSIATYENKNKKYWGYGHKQFLSFGSLSAQINMENPPVQMPDIGGVCYPGYQLIAIVRGSGNVEDIEDKDKGSIVKDRLYRVELRTAIYVLAKSEECAKDVASEFGYEDVKVFGANYHDVQVVLGINDVPETWLKGIPYRNGEYGDDEPTIEEILQMRDNE